MKIILGLFLIEKCLRKATLALFLGLSLLSSEVSANNSLDVGCLPAYRSWLKPVETLEVSALPAPIKIKLAGVKSFVGEVPQGCGGHIPPGAQLRIFTLNDQLYSLELTIKTSKPYFSHYIQAKEISRMEASFRRNSYAFSSFSTNIDRSLSLTYQIELVSGGFFERLSYKSSESAKYE